MSSLPRIRQVFVAVCAFGVATALNAQTDSEEPPPFFIHAAIRDGDIEAIKTKIQAG